MQYKPVKNLPIAKFWYKGHHTHPVKRTILVIESTRKHIRGYELREGKTVRTLNKAPIKSYIKDKMATAEQLRNDNPIRREKSTTYKRVSLLDVIESGI